MRIDGRWLMCDDGVRRPVISGEIRTADGSWEKSEFLGHCSRDPGFDMDTAIDHFYTTGSNRFSRGANDVWTG